MPAASANLIDAIAVSAELCGTQLSKPAATQLAQDLADFDELLVIKALARCRLELKGRLTVAEVLSRLDDGRPGPDEAWGLAVWSEATTAVITPEIASAMEAARPLMEAGDKYGAKQAFREVYVREVNRARQAGKPVNWYASLGWDSSEREGVIREAVATGKLTLAQAAADIPHLASDPELLALARPEAENMVKRLAEARQMRRIPAKEPLV